MKEAGYMSIAVYFTVLPLGARARVFKRLLTQLFNRDGASIYVQPFCSLTNYIENNIISSFNALNILVIIKTTISAIKF
jgi:hypothetical protein